MARDLPNRIAQLHILLEALSCTLNSHCYPGIPCLCNKVGTELGGINPTSVTTADTISAGVKS